MIKWHNVKKIFFPQQNFTKKDILNYYSKASEYILPYLKNRPLTVKRYPNGIKEDGFFQKRSQKYHPDWIDSQKIKMKSEKGKYIKQPICNNKKTLEYFVDKGAIELHLSLAKSSHPYKPVIMVFDLDPSQDNFKKIKKAALIFHDFFESLEIPNFPLLTGSKGLHVIVPLDGNSNFKKVKSIAEKIQSIIIKNNSDLFTKNIRKNKRANKVFIDILRNDYGQTSISPYSVRAIKGAPIAAPITWYELKDKNINSQSYNIKNIFARLGQIKQPWQNFFKKGISISKIENKKEVKNANI
jgi:bifunctional non-homologous end joining protein LigD